MRLENKKKVQRSKGTSEEGTYISDELTNESGKNDIPEVARKESGEELVRIPSHEAVTTISPTHHRVCGRILHHVVFLCHKRR